MEHDPNSEQKASPKTAPGLDQDAPINLESGSAGEPAAVQPPGSAPQEARDVATAWCGGVPASVRAAATASDAAVNHTGVTTDVGQPQVLEAGRGFARFWTTTCLYWASSPQSLLKK